MTWFLLLPDENVTQEDCNLSRLQKEDVNQLGVVSLEYRAKQQESLGFNPIPTRETGRAVVTAGRGHMAHEEEYSSPSPTLYSGEGQQLGTRLLYGQKPWFSKTPHSWF